MALNATRIKLLKIWEILCRETDEDHPMSSTVIIEKLSKQGVSCNRKTLYGDIKLLCEYGYEVMSFRGHCNEYYVTERNFTLPELRILIDSVQTMGFITQKKTSELIDKLARLAGDKKGELLKQNLITVNDIKSSDEKIYYTISSITESLDRKKKIEFKYFDYDINRRRIYRNNEKPLVVNPISTTIINNKYYLLCYLDDRNKIDYYRVDRMDSIKICEEEIQKNNEFDTTKNIRYSKDIVNNDSEKEELITIRAEAELIDEMYDKFGDRIRLYPVNNGFEFSVSVKLNSEFFGWCCSFDDKIHIVYPPEAANKFCEYICNISKSYSNDKNEFNN